MTTPRNARAAASYMASIFNYRYGMILVNRPLPSGNMTVICEPARAHMKADMIELGQRVLSAMRDENGWG